MTFVSSSFDMALYVLAVIAWILVILAGVALGAYLLKGIIVTTYRILFKCRYMIGILFGVIAVFILSLKIFGDWTSQLSATAIMAGCVLFFGWLILEWYKTYRR